MPVAPEGLVELVDEPEPEYAPVGGVAAAPALDCPGVVPAGGVAAALVAEEPEPGYAPVGPPVGVPILEAAGVAWAEVALPTGAGASAGRGV